MKTLHDQSQFIAWCGSVLAAMEMVDLPVWTKVNLIKMKLPLESPYRRSLEQMLKGVTMDAMPSVEDILNSLGKATPRLRKARRPMLDFQCFRQESDETLEMAYNRFTVICTEINSDPDYARMTQP